VTKLLYLCHADPSVAPKYRAALDPDVDVVAFVAPGLPGVPGGGMSSRYQAFTLAAPSLEVLAKKYAPPKKLDAYEEVWLATWSAGYAYPRGLLPTQRDRFAGIVLLDSGHTDKDADGTARDAGVAWAVDYVKQGRPLWIGHTDVKTYGTTASTTQFATEVKRLAAGAPSLVVRAIDVKKSDHDEHVAALHEWGPLFVAEAMGASGKPGLGSRIAGALSGAVSWLVSGLRPTRRRSTPTTRRSAYPWVRRGARRR
jgi:hypothetical protein